MAKKILAIHSNSLFFGADTPNFYQWLADRRGIGTEMQKIQTEYSAQKKNKPSLLRKAYGLAMNGLTDKELTKYIIQFFTSGPFIGCSLSRATHLIEKISEEYEVYVFTSYPVEVFEYPQTTFRTIGPRANYGNYKIKSWRYISTSTFISFINFQQYQDAESFAIKKGIIADNPSKLLNTHFFTPDQYGLALKLIDIMLEKNISANDLVVLGSSVTAEPMHKIGGKRIEKLEELL